ncbi:MAG: Ldh family oxidoreductase [Balneolaceae bacterium]|nr:MAG: Ldh family oxidoreductase [Balneolaceae bacterium]
MRIPFDELLERTRTLFEENGLQPEYAKITAEAICTASLRGTDSHGIRLIPHYIRAIKAGRIEAGVSFDFRKTSLSTGILDARHGMAHAAVARAMDYATELAAEAGSGFVAVKNSNHCGAMAYYALRAAEKGMIGLAFTNATAKVKVFNATRPFFGINPLCVAAPMEGEEPFCYDAAPTVMSNNKVKMVAEAGQELPEWVAADKAGKMTRDPALSKMLLPLGGELGGYKGYGMAMVADIFSSLLSGMPNGLQVSSMYPSDGGDLDKKRYLGQFVGAIRIDLFEEASVFKERMRKTAEEVRNLNREDPEREVMIPGDPEKKVAEKRRREGIELSGELQDLFGI